MRGFTKAAALVLSTFASALVIPEPSPSLSVRPSDLVVEYHSSDAVLKFPIATARGSFKEQLFTFQYSTKTETDTCAGNDILVNGQLLKLQWHQHHAFGRGNLFLHDSKTQIRASWQLSCLGGIPTSEDLDGVQVFSFIIFSPNEEIGFTVSFKQNRPKIVRFVPAPSDIPTIEASGVLWRTPSPRFSSGASTSGNHYVGPIAEPSSSQQKSLKTEFHRLGDFLGEKVKAVKNLASKALQNCRHHFASVHRVFNNFSERFHNVICQRPKGRHELSKHFRGATLVPADASGLSLSKHMDAVHQDRLVPTPASESADRIHSTAPSATQTRSITTSTYPNTKYHGPHSSLPSEVDQRFHNLKFLGLVVFVSALLFWVFKRLRDPRRRADRAACREERRRRCLYKRAARIQAFRNWFCAFRRTYCPSRQLPTNWDEKRTRVEEQEAILEEVMKNNIHSLHRAYYIQNPIESAEEGRYLYMDEIDNSSRSDRRRSVATLPGYESEATQPPGYESDAVSVQGGFRYAAADGEDTPDSSVISTSPRISRDGRDSDFGKENIADWSLEEGQVAGFRI